MSCKFFSFAEALAVHDDGIARNSEAADETFKDDPNDDLTTRRDKNV
jgi:hypothetical protein